MELPSFDAATALVSLKRSLRDLKLSERGNAFELRGKRVVELAVEGDAIAARVARRLALTPEWDRMALKSSPDVRKLIDDVKKRLERWERED